MLAFVDYYTTQDVANLTGYSATTVLKYSREGLLPPYRENVPGLGKRKVWPKADIDICVARMRQIQNKEVEPKQIDIFDKNKQEKVSTREQAQPDFKAVLLCIAETFTDCADKIRELLSQN